MHTFGRASAKWLAPALFLYLAPKPPATSEKHFEIVWEAGIYNLADYPTKHHFSTHNKKLRPIYLYEEGRSPRTIKECEDMLESLKPTKKALKVVKAYNYLLAAAAA